MRLRLHPLPLLLVACGEDGTRASMLTIAPLGFTFGEVRDACVRPKLRFCFENLGGAVTLEALDLVRTPPDAPFTLTSVEGVASSEIAGQTMEAGARLCAEILYAPVAPGLHSASLELRVAGTPEPFAIPMGASSAVEGSIVEDFGTGVGPLDLLLVVDGRATGQDKERVLQLELFRMVRDLQRMSDLRVFAIDPLSPDVLSLRRLPDDPSPEDLMAPAYSGALPNQGLLAMANLFLQQGPLSSGRSLLVAFVSTEDDGSPGPPELYSSFVSRLYSGGSSPLGASFAAFVLFESGTSHCQWQPLEGTHAQRYIRALSSFPSSMLSLCAPRWTESLVLRPTPAQLRLKARARAESIRVSTVDQGVEELFGGYLFDQATNTLVWNNGSGRPPAGSVLRVRYRAACL